MIIAIVSLFLAAFVTPADPVSLFVATTAIMIMAISTYLIGFRLGSRSVSYDYPRCSKCSYNLTGTWKAGGATCPECGTPLDDAAGKDA